MFRVHSYLVVDKFVSVCILLEVPENNPDVRAKNVYFLGNTRDYVKFRLQTLRSRVEYLSTARISPVFDVPVAIRDTDSPIAVVFDYVNDEIHYFRVHLIWSARFHQPIRSFHRPVVAQLPVIDLNIADGP